MTLSILLKIHLASRGFRGFRAFLPNIRVTRNNFKIDLREKHPSLCWQMWMTLKIFYNFKIRALYYKYLRTRNLRKMGKFSRKLVSVIINHKCTSLEKHSSLLRTL